MIEVTINEKEDKEAAKKYPYVGIDKSNGTMVLFIGAKTGVSLISEFWGVGNYDTCWAEDDFTPVPSITITSRTE